MCLFSLPSARVHRQSQNTHAGTHSSLASGCPPPLSALTLLSHPYVTQHHSPAQEVGTSGKGRTHARTRLSSQKSNHGGNDRLIIVRLLQKHAMICINTGDCFSNIAYPNAVSYLQEEAAFVDCGAQRKALFPVITVGGCRAADVLPGGLVVVH